MKPLDTPIALAAFSTLLNCFPVSRQTIVFLLPILFVPYLIRVATVRMKTGGLGVKANAVHIYHLIHVTVDRRITVFLVFQPCQILVLRKLERPLLAASFQ